MTHNLWTSSAASTTHGPARIGHSYSAWRNSPLGVAATRCPLAPRELAAWRGHDDTVLWPDRHPRSVARRQARKIEGITVPSGVVDARDPSLVDRLFARLLEVLER
jgi:hypothetical protein